MSYALYELLIKIKTHPGLYFGRVSLVALDYFVMGYEFKEHEIESNNCSRIIDWGLFRHYIEKVFGLPETTKGLSLILAENTKTDEEAFHKFFELLEEYLKNNP